MFGAYLLSILGTVIILAIIDIILPNSNISKYIKSFGALFLVASICSHIIDIAKNNFHLDDLIQTSGYQLDDNYIYNTQLQEAEYLSIRLESMLSSRGYPYANVSINILPNQSSMTISTILVDFSETVILSNDQHIINYTAVKEMIAEYIGIEEEKIFIDGY